MTGSGGRGRMRRAVDDGSRARVLRALRRDLALRLDAIPTGTVAAGPAAAALAGRLLAVDKELAGLAAARPAAGEPAGDDAAAALADELARRRERRTAGEP